MNNSIPHSFDFVSDVPSTPGIYAIVNRVNQHFYIGSAKNLLHRKQHHFQDLKAGKHKNSHLQRAYDFYGPDAFLFGIVELVDHVVDLLIREQYYIDTLNPEYNIARVAGSNLGMEFTVEHRGKISAARLADPDMPAQMAKLNADRTDKPLSASHRANIGAAQLGKKLPSITTDRMSAASLNKPKTAEHAANIRAAKLGKPRPPGVIAKMNEARLAKGVSQATRDRMSASKLGKKRPPEVGAKVSATKRAKKLAKQQENQPPLF